MPKTIGWLLVLVMLVVLPPAAGAFNSGSTGADGPFSPTGTGTITVPARPSGVFNHTTITIPAGLTVKFARNATNTPIILLASGDVTIAGTIDVGGSQGGTAIAGTALGPNGGAGGPGGFDGGNGGNGIVSGIGGSGLGPGGGAGSSSCAGSSSGGGGAGYGAPGSAGFEIVGCGTPGSGGSAYGAVALLPLIGGSGGGGAGAFFGATGAGGGGGGGALVVAASGTLTLTGSIVAKGGGAGRAGPSGTSYYAGGGSGGAVRLVATTIAGSNGSIDVTGGIIDVGNSSGVGGRGRIRIEAEANTGSIVYAGSVVPSIGLPTFPTLPTGPMLAIASVGGLAAPPSPGSNYSVPDVVLPPTTASPVPVVIAASNIPAGTTVTVTVVPRNGAGSSMSATLVGTTASSTATASVTIPIDQPFILSATASFILTASAGGPVYAGEPVERVRVTAGFGGVTQVVYVTHTGREIETRGGP